MEEGAVTVEPRDKSKDARSKWGMSRTMISNIMDRCEEAVLSASSKSTVSVIVRRCRARTCSWLARLSATMSFIRSRRHHIRVPEADGNRSLRHRQAAAWPGCRGNPRIPFAGALQGQGREICGRDDRPQRRQEEVRIAHGQDQKQSMVRAARSAFAVRSRRWPTVVRVCRFTVRRRTSMRRSSMTRRVRSPLHRRSKRPEGLAEDRRRHSCCGSRRQAGRRARGQGRRQGGRVRSRRLHLSRPHQGAC
jgi:hypothetical protein